MKKVLLLIVIGLLFIIPYSVRAIENNPLNHLEVQTTGGTGDFDLSTGKKVFNFTLRSPFDYANIIAESSNENYTITGAGKVKCEYGQNKIEVVVTDPSDSTSVTYTINLNFVKYDSATDDDGNPRTGTFMNITILGGCLIGAVVLFGIARKNQVLIK